MSANGGQDGPQGEFLLASGTAPASASGAAPFLLKAKRRGRPPGGHPAAPPLRRAPSCTICRHLMRAQIELDSARGFGRKEIALRYQINPQTVYLHRVRHMPPQLTDSLAQKALATEREVKELKASENRDLLSRLVWQRHKCMQLLAQAEAQGDLAVCNQVHGTLLKLHALESKVLGVVGNTSITNNNLTISPEYLLLRSGLLRALQPHTAARRAVVQVLEAIEGSHLKQAEETIGVVASID